MLYISKHRSNSETIFESSIFRPSPPRHLCSIQLSSKSSGRNTKIAEFLDLNVPVILGLSLFSFFIITIPEKIC